MNVLELKKNNHTVEVSIPSNWNELMSSHVFYIAENWRAWQLMLNNGLDMQKARARLFLLLIINHTNKQKLGIAKLLSAVDYSKLEWSPLHLVDFVFDKILLTKNPLPHFGFFSRFYGPADQLKNITIFEFSHALHFYNQYNKTEDRQALDMMVACMYRRKAKNWEETGDIRMPFNPNTADKYLRRISRLKYEKKEAVFLFFLGVMFSWSQRFPHVFSKADPKHTPTGGTFVDVVLEMSGGKFGTFEHTQQINAYTFLKELNNKIIESIKQANKSKK